MCLQFVGVEFVFVGVLQCSVNGFVDVGVKRDDIEGDGNLVFQPFLCRVGETLDKIGRAVEMSGNLF